LRGPFCAPYLFNDVVKALPPGVTAGVTANRSRRCSSRRQTTPYWRTRSSRYIDLASLVTVAFDKNCDGPSAGVLAVWDGALASTGFRPDVWIHGDTTGSNRLVRLDRPCSVIDFGGVAMGDRASDLTLAWTTFESSRALADQGDEIASGFNADDSKLLKASPSDVVEIGYARNANKYLVRVVYSVEYMVTGSDDFEGEAHSPETYDPWVELDSERTEVVDARVHTWSSVSDSI
jgi:hypothetical protein